MSNADALREILGQYDKKRAQWIAHHGSDKGFDKWFTEQIIKKAK